MSEEKKQNKYIKPMTEEERSYWGDKPKWFKDGHQRPWYDRIDLNAIEDDAGEQNGTEIADLIHDLIHYVRIRDRVIEHRKSVVNHTAHLLNVALRYPGNAVQLEAQIRLISNYLQQMQVVSGLEPLAPDGRNPFPEGGE